MPINDERVIVAYSYGFTLTGGLQTMPNCLGLTSQLFPLFRYEGKTPKTAHDKKGFWTLLKT